MASTVPVITVRRGERIIDRMSAGLRGLDFGSHVDDDLFSPHASLKRFPVLRRSLSGWRLRVPAGSAAVFIRGGSTVSLDDMVQWGLVKRAKGSALVRLEKGMEVRVKLGEDSLTVGFGPPIAPHRLLPEPAAAGRLPRELRRRPFSHGDWFYASLLTLLVLTASASLVWLRQVPWPTGVPTLESMPYRISKLLFERAPTPPSALLPSTEGRGPAAKGEAEAPSAGEPAAAEQPQAPKPPEQAAPSPGPGAVPSAPSGMTREAIREQVSKVGILGVLSGRGTAGRSVARSPVTTLQLDVDLEQRLDEVLNTVGGITVAAPGGSGGGAGGTGSGEGGGLLGIEGLVSSSGVGGPVQVSRLEGIPSGVPGGEGLEEADEGAGGANVPAETREERSSRAIARIVAAHTGAIRYAYNRELRKNPALRGKVVLRFSILPEGDVVECVLEQSEMNWPPLENSLIKIVLGWKFPPIPHGVVTVSYPFVFFPSM